MDLTVRVWDITGLKKKHQAHQAPMSMEEQLARANQGQADLFGNTDAVVSEGVISRNFGISFSPYTG
jgi:coatomer protein complex subunit alpha (xenin)